MLKQRLLTAAILLPLVIGGIFTLSSAIFSLVTAVVILLGSWEWAALMGSRWRGTRPAYVVMIAAMLVGMEFVRRQLPVHSSWLVVFAAIWLPVCFWLVIANRSADRVNYPYPLWLLALTGILVLVPAWLAFSILHRMPGTGPWQVLFVMVLVWSADSGAYLAGRKFGVHKLASLISPGKTWEGVIGGMVFAAVPAILAGIYWYGSIGALMLFSLVCLVTVVFSIVGDLLESLLKRQARVKDSGTLLPGHGGILDRIDSLTAAAPVYVAGMVITGYL